MKEKPLEDQVAEFIAKFTPDIAEIAWDAFDKLRKRLAGAVILVYDNYYALVMGFGPTERSCEVFLLLVVYPRWVSVCFLQGVKQPDPQNLLDGQGKQVRSIRLENARILDKPAIKALISEAVKFWGKPLSDHYQAYVGKSTFTTFRDTEREAKKLSERDLYPFSSAEALDIISIETDIPTLPTFSKPGGFVNGAFGANVACI
jgi:Domain of unknown function (DU1801)